MVSESSDSPDRSFQIWNSTGSKTAIVLPNGLHRTQLGYRSRSLTLEEERGIIPSSIQGNIGSLLAHYDEVLDGPYHGPTYGKHPSRAFVVNDRDATKTTFRPSGFNATVTFSRFGVPRDPSNHQGALGMTGFTTSVIPSLPSSAVIESMAGKLMRRAKPSVAGANLARIAAEQRDAPALFKASNYRPRNYKQVAGSYLNYLFGVKPTGSDLLRVADTVMGFDGHIRRVINAEKIIQKSRRSIVLYEADNSGFSSGKNSLDYTAYRAFNLGPLQMAGGYLIPAGGSSAVLAPQFNYSYTVSQRLTQFSTWEFFIPKPDEIHSRLDTYKKRAERVLSSARITEGDVYELAPWTWLADWFVDIGGLLQYQRDVVDNQIVASANGYSVWEEFTGICSYSGRRYDATGVSPAYQVLKDTFIPFHASIQWRRHKRRGATPYSIGPTWNFSTQQWAILGALGLSRGPGLPIKRG